MKDRTKEKTGVFFRILLLVICLGLVVLGIIYRDRLTVESIIVLAPENPYFTALVIVGLYAVKSLSVVFPMIVLNVASGILLPPLEALIVNILGTAVMTAIPYFVGCFSGSNYYEKLKNKYPKVYAAMNEGKKSTFFFAFFLRIISCLPGDVVSMFFGAMRVDFLKYMAGSLLGILPGTVLATFMGVGIMNPREPIFAVSLGINLSLSVLSFVLHRVLQNRKKKQ